jgi:LemA protein
MDLTLIIVLAVIAAIVLFVVFAYNGLVRLRNQVDEAWNQISVQLKRRHDLIPNLVNAVRGYMEFEQETLQNVTNARAQAVAAGAAGPQNAAQTAAAENVLTGALRSLFAVVENYPELRANQNVMQLQEELTTTENQIGFSRQHYNSSVRELNTAIQTFPNVVIAGPFGFRERDYFQIEEADAAVPVVNLRGTTG